MKSKTTTVTISRKLVEELQQHVAPYLDGTEAVTVAIEGYIMDRDQEKLLKLVEEQRKEIRRLAVPKIAAATPKQLRDALKSLKGVI
jgi:DNA polymerase I-like protein with 3'-5' exonuclease and polymerase domains